MEYQGLWEDETPKTSTIYKVTEFYDWHNCNPDVDTTIFVGKELALHYMSKRLKEIPSEMFEGYSPDYINKVKNPDGSICIHNDNDYWTISLKKGELISSVTQCYPDYEGIIRRESQIDKVEEETKIRLHNYFFCHPDSDESSLFQSEKQ